MRYLKTYFFAPFEMKFLKLNYLESKGHIDKFIVCEFNRTHTGAPRELIWDRLKFRYFSKEELKDIIYIGGDISRDTRYSVTDGTISHQNERLMRGYFASQIGLCGRDVVIAVDADEIIFGPSYEEIIPRLGFFNRGFKLDLNLFIYKINYLWKDEPFIAPMICRGDFYWGRYPSQWRYDGTLYPGKHGCHFTWCMSVEQMVDKIKRYAHAQDYSELADPDIMQRAIETKIYPFEPSRRFEIEAKDIDTDRSFFPASLYQMLDQFQEYVAAY